MFQQYPSIMLTQFFWNYVCPPVFTDETLYWPSIYLSTSVILTAMKFYFIMKTYFLSENIRKIWQDFKKICYVLPTLQYGRILLKADYRTSNSTWLPIGPFGTTRLHRPIRWLLSKVFCCTCTLACHHIWCFRFKFNNIWYVLTANVNM